MFSEQVHKGVTTIKGDDIHEQVDTEQRPDQTMVCPELKYGYTVGVDEEGKFVFQLHGKEKGFVELLGLTKFAEQQINTLMDSTLGQGLPRVNAGLAMLNGKLEEILERMNAQEDV